MHREPLNRQQLEQLINNPVYRTAMLYMAVGFFFCFVGAIYFSLGIADILAWLLSVGAMAGLLAYSINLKNTQQGESKTFSTSFYAHLLGFYCSSIVACIFFAINLWRAEHKFLAWIAIIILIIDIVVLTPVIILWFVRTHKNNLAALRTNAAQANPHQANPYQPNPQQANAYQASPQQQYIQPVVEAYNMRKHGYMREQPLKVSPKYVILFLLATPIGLLCALASLYVSDDYTELQSLMYIAMLLLLALLFLAVGITYLVLIIKTINRRKLLKSKAKAYERGQRAYVTTATITKHTIVSLSTRLLFPNVDTQRGYKVHYSFQDNGIERKAWGFLPENVAGGFFYTEGVSLLSNHFAPLNFDFVQVKIIFDQDFCAILGVIGDENKLEEYKKPRNILPFILR